MMGFSIMKQARGAAKTTIKFKNLKRGNTIENTYRSGEKFETAEITRKPSQFTYEDEVSEKFVIPTSTRFVRGCCVLCFPFYFRILTHSLLFVVIKVW